MTVPLQAIEMGCASLNKAVSGQHSEINNLDVDWFRIAEFQNLATSVMPPTKSNPPMIRPAFNG